MCHFYANPLSILLAIPSLEPEALSNLLTTTHLDAIRSLPSIRQFIEGKLAENDTAEVRAILSDNAYLIGDLIPHFVGLLRDKARELREAVIVLDKLSERSPKAKRGLGDLYLDALAGEPSEDVPYVKELLLLQRYIFPNLN
jgi:origin recognition complex subunit 3